MKRSFSKKHRPDPELLALKEELKDAQWELTLAYRRFNRAVDPELVESCIYQISAAKARCNYLIRIIKEREAAAETVLAAGPSRPRQTIDVRQSRSALPANPTAGSSACGDEGDAVWT